MISLFLLTGSVTLKRKARTLVEYVLFLFQGGIPELLHYHYTTLKFLIIPDIYFFCNFPDSQTPQIYTILICEMM